MTDAPFAYSGPPALQPIIERALRRVVDPEIVLSILDVGLVYGVNVADDRVDVRMTMTSAACPVADVIRADVETELDADLPPALRIHVELVWQPPWNAERLSGRARAFMGT